MKSLRVIVVGLGSAGDVHPNVGLSLTLRENGSEVLFVGPEIFRPLAERTGLDFIGIGSKDEYYAAIHDPDLWHPVRSFAVVARRLIVPALRPVYEIIEKNFQPGSTVVAASGLAFGARIAQERLGVPLATVHLQPIMLRSAIRPGCFGFPDIVGHLPRPFRSFYFRAADRMFVDRWLTQPVNSFRAELGLRPVRRLFDRWIHSPQLVIGLFPEWYAPHQSDWPPNVSLTDFPLWDESEIHSRSEELEEFLAGGDPPLVFTAGSAMLRRSVFLKSPSRSVVRLAVAVCYSPNSGSSFRTSCPPDYVIFITSRSALYCHALLPYSITEVSGQQHKRFQLVFRNLSFPTLTTNPIMPSGSVGWVLVIIFFRGLTQKRM